MLLNIFFNIILPTTHVSPELLPQGFPSKILYNSVHVPRMLHVPFIHPLYSLCYHVRGSSF